MTSKHAEPDKEQDQSLEPEEELDSSSATIPPILTTSDDPVRLYMRRDRPD